MIARFGAACARLAQHWVPSSFVFTLLLSAVVLIAGWCSWPREQGAALSGVLEAWYRGFWSKDLLAFAFQMALMLVAGYALADAPLTRTGLRRLAGAWRTPRQAVALTALVAAALSWCNWGLGILGGAFLAREVGAVARRRGQPIPYALVVAAAYGGFLVWHGGLSASAPLSVAQPGHPFEEIAGVIPVRETLFAPSNLFLSAALLVAIPLILASMASAAPLTAAADLPAGASVADAGRPPQTRGGATPAAWMDRSGALAWLVLLPAAAVLALVLVPGWWRGTRSLDLNTVLFLCLFLAFALHRSPAALARSFAAGASEAGGILLQFPFYFAIAGVMQESGLVARLAGVGVSLALAAGAAGGPVRWIFLVQTWLIAALVNMAVPSGGGQWAVQGEIVLRSAQHPEIQAPAGQAVMALAYGDEWTNLAQPFWALALLSVTRMQARDILGYTLALMVLTGPLFLIALAF
ncbi:MAG: short-chain fatty acid transporter [Planctomycetota bacterium]|nr:MAG: short-chain fatty acid transporter [Planctomycetota bacterium]